MLYFPAPSINAQPRVKMKSWRLMQINQETIGPITVIMGSAKNTGFSARMSTNIIDITEDKNNFIVMTESSREYLLPKKGEKTEDKDFKNLMVMFKQRMAKEKAEYNFINSIDFIKYIKKPGIN